MICDVQDSVQDKQILKDMDVMMSCGGHKTYKKIDDETEVLIYTTGRGRTMGIFRKYGKIELEINGKKINPTASMLQKCYAALCKYKHNNEKVISPEEIIIAEQKRDIYKMYAKGRIQQCIMPKANHQKQQVVLLPKNTKISTIKCYNKEYVHYDVVYSKLESRLTQILLNDGKIVSYSNIHLSDEINGLWHVEFDDKDFSFKSPQSARDFAALISGGGRVVSVANNPEIVFRCLKSVKQKR